MGLNVVARPALDTFTSIQADVEQYLQSQDLRVSWQTADPKRISRVHARGQVPLTISMVEEDDPEMAKRIRQTMFVTEEGYIGAEDCILCVQPSSMYEAEQKRLHEENRLKSLAKPFVEAQDNEIQRLAARAAGRPMGRSMIANPEVHDVQDHVSVSKRPHDG